MNNSELDNTLIITRRHKKDNEFIFSHQCVLSSVEKMFSYIEDNSNLIIEKIPEDTRKVWEIDRDKHLRKLNDIGKKADAKGLYGVSLKAEELRGKVAGLYIEKQMIMKTELTLDELNAKWKSLFKSREEMEQTHISMLDDVWGKEEQVIEDTKQLEKATEDEKLGKELKKFHKDHEKDRP